MLKTKMGIAVIAATITLTGCANHQQTGQMLGAVGGGLVCGVLTKNSPDMIRLIAMGGCAYLGSHFGAMIGKNLDQRDQEALALATQSALSSNTNQAATTSWKSDSGATASLSVGKTFKKTEPVTMKRSVSVQPVSNVEKLNAPYVTIRGANIRSAPSTSGDKLGSMAALTEFNAMGKTGDWILVGRQGALVGYVHAPLVKSKAVYERELNESEIARVAKLNRDNANAAARARTTAAIPAKERESLERAPASVEVSKPAVVAPAPAPAVVKPKPIKFTPAVKLETATVSTSPDLSLIFQPVATVTTEVVQETTCRSLTSRVVSSDGKVEESQVDACKSVEADLWAGI